jgi:hypothetical protein
MMNYTASSGGGPNMGYPGMGAAAPAGMPGGLPQAGQQPQQPGSDPMALIRAKLATMLGSVNPIGSANASVLHPDLSNPMGLNQPPSPPTPSRPLPPGAANSLPLATGNVTSDDYRNWLMSKLAPEQQPLLPQARGVGGAPYTGPSVLPQARGVANPNFPGSPSAPPAPTSSTSAAPAGSSSATPRPASSVANPAGAPNNRFGGTVQYDVPGSSYRTSGQGVPRGGQGPIYTAANFGNLFGGGQPAATNPANVPAPNAQPVSATRAAGPLARNGGGFAVGTPDFSNLPDDIFDQSGAGPSWFPSSNNPMPWRKRTM